MYSDELRKIADIMQTLYGICDLPASADPNKIENFVEKTRTVLRSDLPKDFIDFLRECDGLEFDGYIIYGTDNFLDSQDDYEYISKQYIIFGEYDIGWFCMRKSDSSFWELDKPSGQEMQQFLSVKSMIKHILNRSII